VVVREELTLQMLHFLVDQVVALEQVTTELLQVMQHQDRETVADL
jgi:hypothetical protein